jgi:hypothetical protein
MPEPEDALVPVEEYLDRFVNGGEKPTCEYVDSELFPKSMGTKKHSKTQQNIQYYIRQKYGQAFDPLPELTTRLRKRSFMSLMSLSKIGRTTSMSAFTVALDLRATTPISSLLPHKILLQSTRP